MSIHPLRNIVQKFGFDIRRYRPGPDLMHWIRTLDIQTIVDVGANVGQFAVEMRAELPHASIYSFEPLLECFEKLNELAKRDTSLHAFHAALGDTDASLTIHKSSYTLSSSLLEMAPLHKSAFPHTAGSSEEAVRVQTMDNFFAKRQLAPNILIKIDTQGYEDKVIAGGKNTLQKAKLLIIETSFTPLYINQPLFADIYAALSSLGFAYRGALHQKHHPQTGEILFEDSLFSRTA